MLAFFRERGRGALFADVTVRETAAATREWSNGDEVDVADATRRISFATLCSTTLGITDPADQHRLADQLDMWIEYCMVPGNRLRGWYGQVGDAAEDMSCQLITAILNMVQHLRHGSGEHPLIDWLFDVADRRIISSAALIGQLVTLLTAGWETTSAAMCWTLLLLAHHEPAARRLFTELTGFREPPDVRMLDRLPVLDGVVRESLRLFSPAIGIKRIAAFDQSVAGRYGGARAADCSWRVRRLAGGRPGVQRLPGRARRFPAADRCGLRDRAAAAGTSGCQPARCRVHQPRASRSLR
jgi:cytochrome P450